MHQVRLLCILDEYRGSCLQVGFVDVDVKWLLEEEQEAGKKSCSQERPLGRQHHTRRICCWVRAARQQLPKYVER